MEALIVVFALILLATPLLAIWALVRASRISTRLGLIERRLSNPASAPGDAPARRDRDAAPEQPTESHRRSAPEGPLSGLGSSDPEPEPEPVPEAQEASEDRRAGAPGRGAARDDETPSVGAVPAKGGWVRFEERLAGRWLVWLGSLALALGGIFLVKYGIDRDLLSPAARIALGGLFGAALIAAGEWLRRRPLQRAIAALGPDLVPPALSAAGIAVCFGSLFAGYELYGLFGPLFAFLSMAAVAVAALALSLIQGPLIAVMGLLGAFAVPLLVQSEAPSAWALFPYLWLVAAGALAVVRFRDWWWLAWMTLLGAAGWALLWVTSLWQTGDAMALSAHLVVSLVLFAAPRFEQLVSDRAAPLNPFDPIAMPMARRLAQASALCVCAILVLLLRADGWGGTSLTACFVVLLALVASALRLPAQENLLALAAATALAVLATWITPTLADLVAEQNALARDVAPLAASFLPPRFADFCGVAAAIALLFGGAGSFGLWRSRFPGLWASVSAVVPLLVLAILYWRLEAAGVSLPWGAISLGLAGLALAAASRVAGSRASPGMESALGCYSLAVSAGLTLAVALTLEEKWWPIALALQLPAAAWVDHRLRIRYLRPISVVIALYVSARLLLQSLPVFPVAPPDDGFAILYGYGVPAAAFALAGYWFRRRSDDWLITVLESGTIALGVALVTLEIDHFIGRLDAGQSFGLLDQSLKSISWLATGWALYRRDRIAPRAVTRWSARLLIAAAAGQVLLFQLALSSPLITGDPVGAWPIVDRLLLAYALPAGFALLIHREAGRQGHGAAALWAGVISIALLFVYLTLEVRHIVHGPVLRGGPVTAAEGYAYSLVWLAYAGALLAGGLVSRNTRLRTASLTLVLIVVAKVFLWDMSWLTGLYRVGSFVCLGLSLVGVGYLYQRLVFRPATDPQAP